MRERRLRLARNIRRISRWEIPPFSGFFPHAFWGRSIRRGRLYHAVPEKQPEFFDRGEIFLPRMVNAVKEREHARNAGLSELQSSCREKICSQTGYEGIFFAVTETMISEAFSAAGIVTGENRVRFETPLDHRFPHEAPTIPRFPVSSAADRISRLHSLPADIDELPRI